MVAFSTLVSAGLFVVASNAAPTTHHKRIAQVIADSTKDWVAACTAAGGAQQCNPVSQTAFGTLLAAGGNCDQQDAADKMVDLAKTLNNDADMIKLAQLFAQQPRNAPDSLQVPYCQKAPKNQELTGFFHCQFAGTVKDGAASKFSGDQTGNLPLGVAAVNPPGSCPASKTPVDDGAQLTDSTQDPGTPEGGDAGAAAGGAGAANATGAAAGAAGAGAGAGAAGAAGAGAGAGSAGAGGAGVGAGSAGAAGGANKKVTRAAAKFPQNGPAAQQQNADFANLSADSPCTDGDQACVAGGFAQCVGGKFSITQCAGGTQCFALPLVNKEGTSVTCSTEADATARIAATGAQGGVTGSA